MFNVDYGAIDFYSYNHALALFWVVRFFAAMVGHRVVSVIDGDTIKVRRPWSTKPVSIRLAEIDAPESKQEGGIESMIALAIMCPPGSRVKLQYQTKAGRYGRPACTIFLNGVDINSEMVRAGHAWHYSDYSDCKWLRDAEDYARKNKIGLWKGRSPTPPWIWRKDRKAANDEGKAKAA